jgi:hypothetical protein
MSDEKEDTKCYDKCYATFAATAARDRATWFYNLPTGRSTLLEICETVRKKYGDDTAILFEALRLSHDDVVEWPPMLFNGTPLAITAKQSQLLAQINKFVKCNYNRQDFHKANIPYIFSLLYRTVAAFPDLEEHPYWMAIVDSLRLNHGGSGGVKYTCAYAKRVSLDAEKNIEERVAKRYRLLEEVNATKKATVGIERRLANEAAIIAVIVELYGEASQVTDERRREAILTLRKRRNKHKH